MLDDRGQGSPAQGCPGIGGTAESEPSGNLQTGERAKCPADDRGHETASDRLEQLLQAGGQAFPRDFFDRQGLVSLLDQHYRFVRSS